MTNHSDHLLNATCEICGAPYETDSCWTLYCPDCERDCRAGDPVRVKSSQPLKVEIVADQLFSGLEAPVMVAYLDQLNRIAGKLKTLESATAELEAEISNINEAIKRLERSL